MLKFESQYNLMTLPNWQQHDGASAQPNERPRWSGKKPPPYIGARVRLTINAFGLATVLSYFVEHGFLGVEVELDNPPQWLLDQCARVGRRPLPKVFGAEMGPVVK